MNITERELLERCSDFLVSIYDAEFAEAEEYVERESIIKDIEAYLAKPVQDPNAKAAKLREAS